MVDISVRLGEKSGRTETRGVEKESPEKRIEHRIMNG